MISNLVNSIISFIIGSVSIGIIVAIFVFACKIFKEQEEKNSYIDKIPEKYSCFNEDELYQIYRHIDFVYRCKNIGYAVLDSKTIANEIASSIYLEMAMRDSEKRNRKDKYSYSVSKYYIESDIDYLRNLLSEHYYI